MKSKNISNFVVKKNKNRVLLPQESLSIIANFEKKQLQKTISQSDNKLSSKKPRILQYGSYEIEEYQNVLLNDGPEIKHTQNIRAVGKNTKDEDIISPASGAEDTDTDKLKKTEQTNTAIKGNWTLNGSSQSSKIKRKHNRTTMENSKDTTNHNSKRIEKTKSTTTTQNIRKRKIGMKNGTTEKNSARFESTTRDNLKRIDSTEKLGVIRNYQLSEYEDAEF